MQWGSSSRPRHTARFCRQTHHHLAGVDDITAVIIILLENNPKDKSWAAAQKLMNNVDKFIERLKGFKGFIDEGKVGDWWRILRHTACLQLPRLIWPSLRVASRQVASFLDPA
jgi:hypothetical protein